MHKCPSPSKRRVEAADVGAWVARVSLITPGWEHAGHSEARTNGRCVVRISQTLRSEASGGVSLPAACANRSATSFLHVEDRRVKRNAFHGRTLRRTFVRNVGVAFDESKSATRLRSGCRDVTCEIAAVSERSPTSDARSLPATRPPVGFGTCSSRSCTPRKLAPPVLPDGNWSWRRGVADQ